MKIALYAGSFDPITNGHLDILTRGAELFDKVIIAVAENEQKKHLLSVNERVSLIKECISGINNAEVCSYSGLTVDFAKKNNVSVLLRGLRNVTDFEYEIQLAQNNNAIAPEIQTVFLMAKPEYAFITSTGVKEIIKYGGNISKMVPTAAENLLHRYFS